MTEPLAKTLRENFRHSPHVRLEDLALALEASEQVLQAEPNVVTLPIDDYGHVIGDIHGQLDDLLAIYDKFVRTCGTELHAPHPLVFLGDYVDRGDDSVAVIALLAALKAALPQRVVLLRGNHESRAMTGKRYKEGLNFQEQVHAAFGKGEHADLVSDVLECCFAWFDALPVAAVLELPSGARHLCVHGGIPRRVRSLSDLVHVDRFKEPPARGPICDMLWSDPINEALALDLSDSEYDDFLDLDFLPNVARGCSHIYGYASLSSFLEDNGLNSLIRAHQVCKTGFRRHFGSVPNRGIHQAALAVTVFSASNYCGTYGNIGAVARVSQSGVERCSFKYDARETSSRVMESSVDPAKFRAAVHEDLSNEKHPGWHTLKRYIDTLSLFKQVPVSSSSSEAFKALQTNLKAHSESSTGALRQVWESMDTNRDGKLSFREMMRYAESFVVTPRTTLKKHIAEMVTLAWEEGIGDDGGTTVTFREFVRYVREISSKDGEDDGSDDGSDAGNEGRNEDRSDDLGDDGNDCGTDGGDLSGDRTDDRNDDGKGGEQDPGIVDRTVDVAVGGNDNGAVTGNDNDVHHDRHPAS